MNQNANNQENNGFTYFLSLFLKNWKALLTVYITVAVVSVVILLLLPNWYKSHATVVILKSQNTSGLSSLLQNFSPFGLSLGQGDEIEQYIGYVKTRKMFDALDKRFDLFTDYELENKDDLYSTLDANIDVYDNENGSFTMSFTYKEDAKKAADILWYMYDQLYQISLEVDQASSSNYRQYLENYLSKVQNDLDKDVQQLIDFQSETGILSLPEQTEATIDILANLESGLIQAEIERQILSTATGTDSRALRNLDNQIDILESKISSLKKEQRTTILSIEGLPEKAAAYLKLQSDVTINKQILELIRIQYEQALMDEKKISSNLYLLDKPSIPEKKFKPVRSKILFVILFFTFTISVIVIRLQDYYLVHKDYLKSIIS